MMVRRVRSMSAYSLDLREKIVESVKKGVPEGRDRPAFRSVDRATVKRYCKQLDERGTLELVRLLTGPRSSTRRREGSL